MEKPNSKIEIYRKSYNSHFFKSKIEYKINGVVNQNYYVKIINNWYEFRLKELEENDNLNERFDLLNDVLISIRLFMINTVELYIAVDRFNYDNPATINKVNLREFEVLSILRSIRVYKLNIGLNFEKGFDDLANKIQNYCSLKLTEGKGNLSNAFFINIAESPLDKEFVKTQYEFDDSINLKETELRSNLNLIEYKKVLNNEFHINITANPLNKEYVKTQNEFDNKEDKELPFYCQIGVLFARDLIIKKTIKDIGNNYFYKQQKFESINKLSNHIKVNVLNTDKSVRQYINDTLMKSGVKNMVSNQTMKENIIEYCKTKNIKIKNKDFISK